MLMSLKQSMLLIEDFISICGELGIELSFCGKIS